MPAFEFDENKSRANLEKHGIDFEAAQVLWRDPDLLALAARTSDEPRVLEIGRISAVHWAAVVTYRNDRIRLISVRRARRSEVELHER